MLIADDVIVQPLIGELANQHRVLVSAIYAQDTLLAEIPSLLFRCQCDRREIPEMPHERRTILPPLRRSRTKYLQVVLSCHAHADDASSDPVVGAGIMMMEESDRLSFILRPRVGLFFLAGGDARVLVWVWGRCSW